MWRWNWSAVRRSMKLVAAVNNTIPENPVASNPIVATIRPPLASSTCNIKISHIWGRQSNNDIRSAWFSWLYAPTFHPHLSMFRVCSLFYGRRLSVETQHHNFLISDFLECRWISHKQSSHASSDELFCRFWIDFLPVALTNRKRHTPFQPRFAQI